MTPPCKDTGSSPGPGYCDMPPEFCFTASRTTLPAAQRRPSPNTTPPPPPATLVPWKYSAELVLGMLEPWSTTVSAVRLGVPVARITPPVPNEWRQPAFAPAGLLLPHGQGVPLP